MISFSFGQKTYIHAGKLIDGVTDIPIEIDIASEFRYRESTVNAKSVVISVSQSGETADTLAAIRKAKDNGALTLGIVNVVGL